jgi:AraC-like DNA-binding protein
MTEAILSYFYFAICFLSAILLVDITVKFKKPLYMKALLLLLVSSLFLQNLSLLLNWSLLWNVSTRVATTFIALNFLYSLYKHQLNKNLLIISILTFGILVFYASIQIDTTNILYSWKALRIITRILISAGILYLSIYIYRKLYASLSDNNIYSQQVKKWTKITIVLFLIGIVNNLLNTFFSSYLLISRSIAVVINSVVCILLIYRPAFINRSELAFSFSKRFVKDNLEKIDDEKFMLEFYHNQYYLRKDTYIEEFAQMLGTNAHFLNDYIREKTQMTFPELINKKRIDHFIELVSNKKFQSYSIEGLSELCGFGTRHSLYRYFKKYHGGSPSDLIRMYE